MSTYFHLDPSDIPWPPVFEKVFTRNQFTMLTDSSCLAEAVVNEEELQLLIDAGAEIIGDVDQAHSWIKQNTELFFQPTEVQ